MFDFPRFRSGHGIRPRDWLPAQHWHNAGTPADLDGLPEDARSVYVRNLPADVIGRLPPGVEVLRLGWCPGLDDNALRSLARLPRLSWLFIDHPVHPVLSPEGLAVLQELPELRAFAFRARPEEDRQPVLTDRHLPALRGATVEALALGNHPALRDLSPLRALPALRTLDLTGCPADAGLPAQVEVLYLDGKRSLSADSASAIGQMARLRTLSLCQRSAEGAAWTLPALETAYLVGSKGVTVAGPALSRLDLGETRLPAPAALAAHAALRAVRLSGHRLSGAHLAALSEVRHLWIEGGAPRLRPADWAGLAACRQLTLSCNLKLRAPQLEAIARLPLERLHVLRGAEKLPAGALAGLAQARWIHLEGCRDSTPLRWARPWARITTEPTALVSG